jgi:pyruvate/2-oxoglutarate dehydrogenase complex dihydrolipoamide acyltransferase (E2) component
MRGFTTLVADRDGVVSAINAEAGQVVAAGQSIVTVAADGEREVSISIPESRVDELRKAQKLTIAVWAHPEKSWSGKLRELRRTLTVSRARTPRAFRSSTQTPIPASCVWHDRIRHGSRRGRQWRGSRAADRRRRSRA